MEGEIEAMTDPTLVTGAGEGPGRGLLRGAGEGARATGPCLVRRAGAGAGTGGGEAGAEEFGERGRAVAAHMGGGGVFHTNILDLLSIP